MTFEADILFEETPYMFCPEFDEGFQTFNSWQQFVHLYIRHMHADHKPMYVHKASITGNNVFVDASQLYAVPWDEIENYI